jgi:periplasmic copper chaperone A
MPKVKILPAFAAILWLAGTALAQAQTAGAGSLEVKDAWARATPAKAANGAVYLTIESAVPDRLTGASTPVAGKAELHRMTMQGNVMRMRQIAGIDLPAGQPVTLKPGGLHIMLLGLKQPLKKGDKFPLTLDFAKAGAQTVDVSIEGVGAMGPNAASGGMPMPAHH